MKNPKRDLGIFCVLMFSDSTCKNSWGTPGYIHKILTMEILKFGDFINEDNSNNLSEQQDMMLKDFKTDVERVLVQDTVARPNFAEGTFGSKPKSLKDMIQDLEYLIADYKAKINEDYNEIDDIDEGMNNIFNKFAGLFSAPNQQDPKTKKDWTELVTKYLDKIETKEPITIAVKLRNMLTEYINGTGYFIKRTGKKFPKQFPHITKRGVEKIIVDKHPSGPKGTGSKLIA